MSFWNNWFSRKTISPPPDRSHVDDETYQKQPPHIRRLIDAMQIIFDDTVTIANAIKCNGPLPKAEEPVDFCAPVRCKDSELLFESDDDDGSKRYSAYYFTEDFNKFDIGAQYGLYRLYGKIYTLNSILGMANPIEYVNEKQLPLELLIDDIIVNSSIFVSFFRSYNRSTDLMKLVLMKQLDENQSLSILSEQLEDWRQKLRLAQEKMFKPEIALDLAPTKKPVFLLCIGNKYQEGQRVINGVYFDKKYADLLMEEIVKAQAQAVTQN